MSVKIQKILVFIATMLLVLTLGTNMVFARQTQGTDGSGSGGSSSDGIIAPNSITPQAPDGDEIQDIGGRILGVLQTIGVVLAVIILVILGIKYMMGSAEEKAEYKKTMVPYLVGAVFIFAAPILANIIYNFVKSLNPDA